MSGEPPAKRAVAEISITTKSDTCGVISLRRHYPDQVLGVAFQPLSPPRSPAPESTYCLRRRSPAWLLRSPRRQFQYARARAPRVEANVPAPQGHRARRLCAAAARPAAPSRTAVRHKRAQRLMPRPGRAGTLDDPAAPAPLTLAAVPAPAGPALMTATNISTAAGPRTAACRRPAPRAGHLLLEALAWPDR